MSSATIARTAHPKEIATVAGAWLAGGATAVSLWQADQLVARWPNQEDKVAASLESVLFNVPAQAPTTLRINGIQGPAAQARLDADTQLLRGLARLNEEVESLAEALGQTEDQLLALYKLTEADSARLNIEQLLATLVRHAARLSKADAAFIVLAPSKVFQFPALWMVDTTALELFARVQQAGGELLLVQDQDVRSGMGMDGNLFLAPMLQKQGAMIAVLGLWLNRPAAELSPDLKLARSIAEQGGTQLEIALLHDELVAQARLQAEMTLARQVQISLLPQRAPQVDGLDIFGESRPALEVGGDFYAFYPTSATTTKRPFAFAVGDISGKGMSAAMLMAMTRTVIRGAASQHATANPASMLARANEDLYDDFTEVGMMATIFVGQYEQGCQTLTFANAGHSPVIYCPAGGSACLLAADGPALGVLPMTLSENQVLHFGPGDLLVVASDGFNEARCAESTESEMFGIARLQQQIEQLAQHSAQEIAQALFAEVERFSLGHPQDDDRTVIVIKGVA
jgi:sigma-B regulation protein RsbU (phosphoserine phosphatase)